MNAPYAVVLAAALAVFNLAYATPPLDFPHGVASGEVTPFSAVLWTRVSGGAGEVPLKVEVALTPDFREPHFQRELKAEAASDFTAKVIAAPLLPEKLYYYRWRHGSAISPTGTFRTAPAPEVPANARFTWTGDSDGTRVDGQPAWNAFEVLDAVRAEGGDFFIYLGDTIYADSEKRAAPAVTLEEYRELYKQNREYPSLQALLQAVSTYVTWDDHEVRDDYSGQTIDPVLYATGRRAFHEYMPTLDLDTPTPGCAGAPRFRVFHWGSEIEFIVLDTHSCRSASALPACVYPSPPLPAGTFDFAPTLPAFIRASLPAFFPPLALIPNCLAAINDPARTMLGTAQKQLFKDALLNSTARYKFVLSPSTIAQTYIIPYSRWEGYAAERAELIRFIRDNAIQNVVFLSTDDHRNLIIPVAVDRLTEPAPIGTEFVTGPIAYATDQALTLGFFGERGLDCSLVANQTKPGCAALAAQNQVYFFLGARCWNVDKYSYGLVEVDAATGIVRITLKDDQGAVVRHQVLGTACAASLGD